MTAVCITTSSGNIAMHGPYYVHFSAELFLSLYVKSYSVSCLRKTCSRSWFFFLCSFQVPHVWPEVIHSILSFCLTLVWNFLFAHWNNRIHLPCPKFVHLFLSLALSRHCSRPADLPTVSTFQGCVCLTVPSLATSEFASDTPFPFYLFRFSAASHSVGK